MQEKKKHYVRPLNIKNGKIEMNYGAGGKASAQLISELFAKYFNNEYLMQGDDGAYLPTPEGHIVMATDSHVVSPIFSPAVISVHYPFMEPLTMFPCAVRNLFT